MIDGALTDRRELRLGGVEVPDGAGTGSDRRGGLLSGEMHGCRVQVEAETRVANLVDECPSLRDGRDPVTSVLGRVGLDAEDDARARRRLTSGTEERGPDGPRRFGGEGPTAPVLR